MRYIPKDQSEMPDFTQENWVVIDTFACGFTYCFYRDTSRPDLKVAAMTAAGELPHVGTLTRLTWQAGDVKRTVRLELDEPVMEHSVYGKDGKRYELDGLMERLRSIRRYDA